MNCPKPGEHYKHYKGNVYEVLFIGVHTETLEQMVAYKDLSGDFIWIRPLKMWQEVVQTTAGPVPRFLLISS